MLNESHTIAAISSAKGVGGIGVVRVSGKRALEIAKNICEADLSPRKVEFTTFKDKKNVLSARQIQKKRRLMKFVKKK